MTFPKAPNPSWMVEEILLYPNDTIIILDDDTSIHGAWDLHFQDILSSRPDIKIQHFAQGGKALDFIKNFNNKENLFLLSDYELLNQDLNGVDIIKHAQTRSILVTSHFTNPDVIKAASNIRTKILPKQLASEVLIKVQENIVKNIITYKFQLLCYQH